MGLDSPGFALHYFSGRQHYISPECKSKSSKRLMLKPRQLRLVYSPALVGAP